jgi:hypothetical protein
MLPSTPQIFYGREIEIEQILHHFEQRPPRIAILGAGGIGKTTLARIVLHHARITTRYGEHRVFVACQTLTSKFQLAAVISEHLSLKQNNDPAHSVVRHFTRSTPYLLILDNLETSWEPLDSRRDIEEFLASLVNVDHLALMVATRPSVLPYLINYQITMRGAERPAKVQWTRPFILPLKPLEPEAARNMFTEITDARYSIEEADRVLALKDNLPLAVSLLAHLADFEGCSVVLSRWDSEKTTIVSEGCNPRSSLDLSISLSLSSPRICSDPPSKEMLRLLSILPDGLSDEELVQTKFPFAKIWRCKTTLIRTSLAYLDEHKRLKVLIPVREYIQRFQPPDESIIKPLRIYFQELLEVYMENANNTKHQVVSQLSTNYFNIQDILAMGSDRAIRTQ